MKRKTEPTPVVEATVASEATIPTDEQLKAAAYEYIVEIEARKSILQQIQAEIQRREALKQQQPS